MMNLIKVPFSPFAQVRSGRRRTVRAVLGRATVVLALTLPAAAGIIVAGAVPDAWACSDSNASNHCYAQAEDNTGNNGVDGNIYIHCLYQPNNGNRASNEMWTTDFSNHWIEVGANSGVDYNGFYDDKNWFWADKRPGSVYFEHDFTNTVPLNTNEFVEIIKTGSDTWNIYGGPYFLGQSTNNEFSAADGIAGTEYEGSSTSGIRDQGHVGSLQWIDSSNHFHNWGTGGFGDPPLGPGAYINDTYDPSSSNVSWSGPC